MGKPMSPPPTSLKSLFFGAAATFSAALENPNATNTHGGRTTFHFMLQRELLDIEEVQQLILAGALLNIRDATGDSPLSTAVKNHALPIIKILVDAGADVEKYEEETGRSLLACVRAYTQDRIFTGYAESLPDTIESEIIDVLLQAGANPDGKDENDRPMLVCYVTTESLETVKRLLLAGADPDAREPWDGYSALYHATVRRNLKLMQVLLTAKADPNADLLIDTSFSSPLEAAIEGKNPVAVELLLHHGADPGLCPATRGKTPLLAAIRLNDLELMDMLVKHRPDIVKLPNNYGLPPLHCALIEQCPTETIVFLLEHGANPNQSSPPHAKYLYPLHLAVVSGRADIVNLLLRHEADPLLKTKEDDTPYQLALKFLGDKNSITARLALAEGAARQRLGIAGKKTIDAPGRHL